MFRFDPDKWGLSVCTVDGQRFTLGDVNEPFTIQSCSKPFTYGINLDKLGPEVVDKYIGQEPSGRDFNEICLDSKSNFLPFFYTKSYWTEYRPNQASQAIGVIPRFVKARQVTKSHIDKFLELAGHLTGT